MKNFLRSVFQVRPFLWIKVLYSFEKQVAKEKQGKKNLEGSNDQIQFLRCQPWFKDNGDETLRLNYPLNENSLVLDVGGYKGEFASAIINKYNCTVHSFEPIQEFYSIIVNKFSNNKKLIPHCCGLSNSTRKENIALLDNSSSVFAKDANVVEIQLKNVLEFLEEHRIEKVDLIKINIEGGEYDLLESLIEHDKIKMFVNIQVQFHDFVITNAKERMNKIQNTLSKTHSLTYQYEFVWENWQLKN